MVSSNIEHLLTNQKLVVATMRVISKEITDLVELACLGEEEAIMRLQKLHTQQDGNILETFLKISSLVMKIIPLEHKIMGTFLSHGINNIPLPPQFTEIEKIDFQAIKEFIERLEGNKHDTIH